MRGLALKRRLERLRRGRMPVEAHRSLSDSRLLGAESLSTLLRKLALFGIAAGVMITLACGGGSTEVGQLKTGPRGTGATPEPEASEGPVVVGVPSLTPIARAAPVPAPMAALLSIPAPTVAPTPSETDLAEAELEASAVSDSESPSEAGATSEPQINLAGVRTRINQPGQIQFVFSPRDENNHAVVVSAEAVRAGMRIFEQEVAAVVVEEEGEVGEDPVVPEIEELLAEGGGSTGGRGAASGNS